jgi:putative endonuclease
MVHRSPFEKRVYHVYILASKPYGTPYIGVTGDLISRVAQHKDGSVPRFTSRYRVYMLVYYEPFGEIEAAIQREKR